MSSPKSGSILTRCAFSFVFLISVIAGNQAFAANSQTTEKVLWSFSYGGLDGDIPNGPLIMDAAGNLYGTTQDGGANMVGTVFELTPTGQESVLWAFGNGDPDGALPGAGLIMDESGNLYGTTSFGGLYENFDFGTGGIVFALTPAGHETDLWNFGNGTDGANPFGGLLQDSTGDLFGTASDGGVYNSGMVFELTPTGQELDLWDFGKGTDGAFPTSTLIKDPTGNFYGITADGGVYSGGTLFKLTPITTPGQASSSSSTSVASYTESILWSFGNGADGKNPDGPPIMDASGNFFGTTGYGGSYGVGTVYEVTAGGQESVLWNFGNGADGQYPNGVIMDTNGNLYGVTSRGGANLDCGFPATASCGTVYELSPPAIASGAWIENILYNFGQFPDAAFPSGNLLMDASGNLYGVSSGGGTVGVGTVFELSNVNPNGQIALSSQHLQFPTTAVGAASSLQLAIRNTGTGQLSGSIAPPPVPFGLKGSGSFNLAPHTQTAITLTFNPTAPTGAHRLATITSNSVKQSSIPLDLRGLGTAPPSPALALNEAPR